MRRISAALTALAVITQGVDARADDKQACIEKSEVAQRLRAEHHLLAARQELIACSAPTCPSVIQQYCTRWLSEVDALTPVIAVAVRDAEGRDVDGLSAELDGVPWLARIDGRATPIDPGPHTIRVSGRGAAVTERVLVVESEKNRIVSIRWPDAPIAQPPATTAPPNDAQTQASGRSWVPFLLAGVGVAAIGSFAYFGLSGNHDLARLHDTCGLTASCAQADVDAARHKLLAADVSLLSGVVLLAISTVIFVREGAAR